MPIIVGANITTVLLLSNLSAILLKSKLSPIGLSRFCSMLASTLADVTLALPDILGSVVLMVADREVGLAVACASKSTEFRAETI